MAPQKFRATRNLTVLPYVVMLGVAACGSPRSAGLGSDGGASDSGGGSDDGSGQDDRFHHDASVPGHDAAPPAVDASVPGHDASPPGVDARPPGVDAAPPGVDAAPPPIDAPPPPPVDAPPPPPPPSGPFPLAVSSDGTTLVTNGGQPFLLHGEAAWSLIVQLSTSDATRYLADRHGRGINALLVNLIEHFYSDHPPANAAGDAPFTTVGDFSTPNERYFAHADQVIDLAASQGMVVLLFPSYLGLMTQEGWRQEMANMASVPGAPKCASYGRFLGQRYASKQNIIWVWGGDYNPTADPKVETCMKAISDAILAAMPAGRSARASAHWSMESTSWDESTFASSIDIAGLYTYSPALPGCRNAIKSKPRRVPTYLIETCYEHDTFGRCPSTSDVRRQQWWALLGCGAGEIYGIEGLWQFSANWQQQLGSTVSVGEQQLFAIAQQVAWQALSLDDTLVTAGQGATGSASEIAAARTADHKQAVLYIPPAAASQFTVDLSHLNGAVTATWQDPTANHSIAAGSGLTASHAFTTPGSNSGGDKDWVLVLTAR